jgi:Fe-S cluster assembly iron-binding protein IscA
MVNLLLTDRACDKVRSLMEQQETENVLLRVFLTSSGNSYPQN